MLRPSSVVSRLYPYEIRRIDFASWQSSEAGAAKKCIVDFRFRRYATRMHICHTSAGSSGEYPGSYMLMFGFYFVLKKTARWVGMRWCNVYVYILKWWCKCGSLQLHLYVLQEAHGTLQFWSINRVSHIRCGFVFLANSTTKSLLNRESHKCPKIWLSIFRLSPKLFYSSR